MEQENGWTRWLRLGWLGGVRTESDEALPCLAQWPLPRPRLLGTLPGSARNINVLVEDSQGSRYVLRGCRRHPRRDRIVFQLDFQDHLRRHDVPVPQVVASQTGERCVESGQGSLWVMSCFVDGRHYQYDSRLQLRRGWVPIGHPCRRSRVRRQAGAG